MSSDLQKQSKRCKRDKRNYDWWITLSTPQTFKSLLNIINGIVSPAPFQVCVNEEWDMTSPPEDIRFTGIRIDAVNASKACMVKAAYECKVETPGQLENPRFCLEIDTLITLLRDVQGSHVVELIKYSDLGAITIRTYNHDDRSNWSVSTVQMIEDMDSQPRDLRKLTFDYVIEMQLDRIKEVCRMVHAIKACKMTFTVKEPKIQAGIEKEHLFSISAENEGVSICKLHRSTSVCESGPDVIRIVRNDAESDFSEEEEGDNYEVKFSESFACMYLHGVFKNMDGKSIQMHFQNHLPLVIHYSLGNDLSYLRVVLAPLQQCD